MHFFVESWQHNFLYFFELCQLNHRNWARGLSTEMKVAMPFSPQHRGCDLFLQFATSFQALPNQKQRSLSAWRFKNTSLPGPRPCEAVPQESGFSARPTTTIHTSQNPWHASTMKQDGSTGGNSFGRALLSITFHLGWEDRNHTRMRIWRNAFWISAEPTNQF